MERGHLIGGVACLMLVILVVQGAVAGSMERTVVKMNESTYRVTFQIPGETVAGITDVVSGGILIGDVSLPPDQFRIEGTTLSLAVIGEREVSYLVTLTPGEPGEITGTFKDMMTGQEGNLPGARISGLGTVEILNAPQQKPVSGEASDARPAPMQPGLIVIAVGAGGLACSFWRRT